MSDPTGDGKTVATFDPASSAYPVLFSQEGEGGIGEIIADNFGDDGFSVADLDRITVPAGGGLAWTIPDEEPSRFIEGVVIHKQPTRAFWFAARGEGGEDDSPPDCASADGLTGVGAFGPGSEPNPSGECAGCPMNVFGSSTRGSGNGKACKEQPLFVLQQGAMLPIQVSLPPTSLRGWRKYMTRLATNSKSYMAVVTRLGLEVTKGGGQTYSVVVPGKGADLNPVEAQAARTYGSTIRGFLEQSVRDRIAREAAAGGPVGGADAADGGRTDDPWAGAPDPDAEPAKG